MSIAVAQPENKRSHLCLIMVSFLVWVWAAPGWSQEVSPTRIEVFWQQSRVVLMPDVKQVVVLDPTICSAETLPDQIRFTGITRGETLAFIWVKQQRHVVLLRVVQESKGEPPGSLRAGLRASPGNGYFGSSVQSASSSQGPAGYLLFHRLYWQQESEGNQLTVQAQAQNASSAGLPVFNMNTASIRYRTRRTTLSFLDFVPGINGGVEAEVVPVTPFNFQMFRGADLLLERGKNQWEMFAGTSLPGYYLTLRGTRDIFGFNFLRRQNDHLFLYATSAATDVPLLEPSGKMERQQNLFQTLGLSSRWGTRWALQATGGASTSGTMGQAAVSYTGSRLSAYLSASRSSSNFPLNQLQILNLGGSSISTGATFLASSRLSASLLYQHTSIASSVFGGASGSSDYFNPNLNFTLTPRQRLTLNYVYSRNRGGLQLGNRTHGQRVDVVWSSQLSDALVNSAQFTLGAISDPLRLNANSQFSFRDALNYHLRRRHMLSVSFSHDRVDASLVSRLNQEMHLLAPSLQELFLQDPLAFVESSDLPPEVRAVLNNLVPATTQVTFSGQFLLRERLNFSPNVGFTHYASGLEQRSNTHLFGYTLSYSIRPTFRLQSSLSNVYVWNSQLQGVQRNTMLSFGIEKTLSGPPLSSLLPGRRHGTIRGRVFRDLNISGVFNTGELGLRGVRVDLSNGQSALTDAQGRFEFTGLKADSYEVTLPLGQFREPIRMTTPSSVRVDLSEPKSVQVDFGVVDFARVMGNVFNDYSMDGKRNPDAPGLRDVQITLTGDGITRRVVTDSIGNFEIDDLRPGEYRLEINPATIPANYVAPATSFTLQVGPTCTLVQDVPVQALRSIAGRLVLKANGSRGGKLNLPGLVNGAPANGNHNANSYSPAVPQPLAGVKLSIGRDIVSTDADGNFRIRDLKQIIATTDREGNFLLRNLPAGELTLTMLPVSALPHAVGLPTWKIRMPTDPIQVQGASITITNPDLIKFVLPVPSGQ
jgi:hypothetical protein